MLRAGQSVLPTLESMRLEKEHKRASGPTGPYRRQFPLAPIGRKMRVASIPVLMIRPVDRLRGTLKGAAAACRECFHTTEKP